MRKIAKVLSLFTAMVVIITSSIIYVDASSIMYKGFSVEINGTTSTAKILDYNGDQADITIPATVYGYEVTAIDEYAFFMALYTVEPMSKSFTSPDDGFIFS